MKKLMVAVALAAMVVPAFAACSDEPVTQCVAWDVNMKLKTLAPKKTTCKSVCGDKSSLYYLDAVTRKIKGYFWACAYDCEATDELNVVLWDTKSKVAVAPLELDGTPITTLPFTFADLMVYGKKANKIAYSGTIVNDELIDVTIAGVNGSIGKSGKTCSGSTCFVKNLSGYAAGQISPVVKSVYSEVVEQGNSGLCGDVVVDICEDEEEDYVIVYTTLCNVCCGWEGWCNEDCNLVELDGMVPAVGTWSMKYNKKMSNGTKNIVQYVPRYAL